MWKLIAKLLPMLLLVSCVTNDQRPVSDEDRSSAQIVGQVTLPLELSEQAGEGKPLRKVFEQRGMSGWLDEAGGWHISKEVHHGRLRCATYETGIQVGSGNPGCTSVEWQTGLQHTAPRRHCNSASLMHTGGGELANGASGFAHATCVRVVTRCEGTC